MRPYTPTVDWRAEKGRKTSCWWHCRDALANPEEVQLFKPGNFFPVQSQIAFVICIWCNAEWHSVWILSISKLGHEENCWWRETRKLRWEFICKVDNFSLGHLHNQADKASFLRPVQGQISTYLKNSVLNQFIYLFIYYLVQLGSKVENWEELCWDLSLTQSDLVFQTAPWYLCSIPTVLDPYLTLS